MKTRLRNLIRLLYLSLAIFATAERASGAEPQPYLALRVSAGGATLSLTGVVGTVYLVQYGTSLSPTNTWVDRTLLRAQSGGTIWTNPSALPEGQRFYRCVSVAAPMDTNLVFIQPGTFKMGSPVSEADRLEHETQHVATVSCGFWMSKFLVTQQDYFTITRTNPSYFNSGDLTRPVDRVNWYDASNYCAIRTEQEQVKGWISTNYLYRLPTEAEWEYACRAGTTTPYYLGGSLRSGQANFDGRWEYDAVAGGVWNPSGVYLQRTTPVGSYAANPWGLYDMIGNVHEWCQDWYGIYPTGHVVDPQGPVSGRTKVARGGYWGGFGEASRSAFRFYNTPILRWEYYGFRVVLALRQ